MSETIEASRKVEVIDPKAVIDIPMSTGFYQKLQELLHFYLKDKSPKEVAGAHAQIKAQKITEDWVEHLQTLFILLKEFQEKAHAAGYVKSMTMEEAEKFIKEYFPESEGADIKVADKLSTENAPEEDSSNA